MHKTIIDQLHRDAIHDEWVDETAENLVKDWQAQLNVLGRIDQLDWEEADLIAEGIRRQMNIQAVLYSEAVQYVENNESEFLIEPTYEY